MAKDWLQKWVGADPDLSESEVLELARDLDGMGMFPEVRDLWRAFQNRVI